MKLLYSNKIESIEGCPCKTFNGKLKLFRFVKSNEIETSFNPKALTAKHLENECNGWGLSVYKNEDAAKNIFNNLSGSLRKKLDSIMYCNVEDSDGIKYQSGKDGNHYTFFPIENFDFKTRFKLVDHEK